MIRSHWHRMCLSDRPSGSFEYNSFKGLGHDRGESNTMIVASEQGVFLLLCK